MSATATRLVLATAILAAPALALGQDRIPEQTLREHHQACVSECQANRDQDYCTAICGCVMDEVRQHFSAAEFEQRMARLAEDPNDADVHRETEQMAAYCAQRLGL